MQRMNKIILIFVLIFVKKSSNKTNNVKKIIDKSLKKNSNIVNTEQKETNKVEQDILKNIKK